jgi:hypothetical protein
MNIEKNVTYVGVVEDNRDPRREGRCKVRVPDIYDIIPTEDIPWASPWKDLSGEEFRVPDIGKVVTVVFDSGNVYHPEYIWSEHYNVNLDKKLKDIPEEDYVSMRALMFNHSTQIYRNDSEGLKMDHELTNINLDRHGNILLNLRDSESVVKLGSEDAEDGVMIADPFLNWMDTFIETMVSNTALLDGKGNPIQMAPPLARILQDYRELRETFRSNHVRIPRNGEIIQQERPYEVRKGDDWSSNVEENTLTEMSGATYELLNDYEPTRVSNENPAKVEEYDPKKFESSIIEGEPEKWEGKSTEEQINAIKLAIESTLRPGRGRGQCARYTYNIALNYIRALTGKSVVGTGGIVVPYEETNDGLLKTRKMLPAGGNAKDRGYFNELRKLGWSEEKIIGSSGNGFLSKEEVIEKLDKYGFKIGDIVSYWGEDRSSQNYAKYGHTQIFQGSKIDKAGAHCWTTDNYDNYGASFVYRSKKCDKWSLYIFRAPGQQTQDEGDLIA